MPIVVQDIIQAALRNIGAYASGESPTPEESDNGLFALNNMISNWSAEGLMIFAATQVNFPSVAAQNTYTIGSSGNINAVRPLSIDQCFIRDSLNVDHPVKIIHRNRYELFTSKTTQARPEFLWYDTQYPLAKLVFYPTPSTIETCYIDTRTALTEFAGLTTTIDMPNEYKHALVKNLAVTIAPEYNRQPSPSLFAEADYSKKVIMSLNIEPVVEVEFDNFLLYRRKPLNINTG